MQILQKQKKSLRKLVILIKSSSSKSLNNRGSGARCVEMPLLCVPGLYYNNFMKMGNTNTVYANVKTHEFGMNCLKGIFGIILTAILILCIRTVLKNALPVEEDTAAKSNVSDNRINLENFGPASWEDILNLRMKEGLSPKDILDNAVIRTAKNPTAGLDNYEKEPVYPLPGSETLKDTVSVDKGIAENTGDTAVIPPHGKDEENNASPALSFNGSLDTVYCVGSTVELEGIEIYMDGRSIPLTDCVIGPADTSTPGGKTVTVSYEGKSVDIPFQVEEYTAVLHGNGGNVGQASVSLWNYVMDESAVETPRRLGKEFDRWYKDADCTVPFTGAVPGEVVTDIYAGWKEFKNFACDDESYITGYPGGPASILNAVLNIPHHADCIGIRSGAFSSLGKEVQDVYIPANITYIPPDAFDTLVYLMFIYVEPSNPVYYSDGMGIVYRKDTNEMVLYPRGNPELTF